MANSDRRDKGQPKTTDDFDAALDQLGGFEPEPAAAANGGHADAGGEAAAPAGKKGGKSAKPASKAATAGGRKQSVRPAANDPREQSFLAALAAARKAPENEAAWTHLEEQADQLQRPDEVADLYGELLDGQLPAEVRGPLAERAVQFCQVWYLDSPERQTSLLQTIVERDPSAEWAFERLTVALTDSEQWDALLRVYDRLLEKTTDEEKRRRLLDDAAHVAKDFAHQSGRAADYILQLLALDPTNAKLIGSLERLLERDERWQDLIDLWRGLMPQLPVGEARATRLKIAVCSLERLKSPEQALDELGALVGESPDDQEACRYLETILDLQTASAEARRRALGLLRKTYEIVNRPDDVIRVLGRALGFAEADERRSLLRELGSRLAILGRDVDAIEYYRELLLADPNDADARKQLRQLGRRSSRDDLHAAALVAAADKASDSTVVVGLLLDAAHVRQDSLADVAGAIELYTKVLEIPDAEHQAALTAAHSLDELLAKSERTNERLATLERLAVLERSAALRQQVLREAALLADRLGDPDRALRNWQPVLDVERPDPEALSSVIDLLERNERWTELVQVLDRRARVTNMPLQRRADLRRMAEILAANLADPAAAIDGWTRVRQEFGEEREVVKALTELYTGAERWSELAELLETAAGQRRSDAGSLLAQLGDVRRLRMNEPDKALPLYVQALGVDPGDAVARAGLHALLEVSACAREAARALVWAYEVTDEWRSVLELLDARLATAPDDAARVRILTEAANLSEERGEDPAGAVDALARALPLEPENLSLEGTLLRLAKPTGAWEKVAKAMRQAALSPRTQPARATELRIEEGRILETELRDFAGALEAYQAAAALRPSDPERLEAVARAGANAGQWDAASIALVAAVRLRDRVDAALVETIEQTADVAGAWSALAAAADRAVAAEADAMPPRLAAAVEARVAIWYRERCDDPSAANDALRRALQHDPSDRKALQQLAAIQRAAPSAELVGTLLKLDDGEPASLDFLLEAAEAAVTATSDVKVQRSTLERLYAKAKKLWTRGDSVTGSQQPAPTVQWAVDRLTELYLRGGLSRAAIDLLVEAANLPVEPARAVALRRRGAEMLLEQGDRLRAIQTYRAALHAAGDDLELVRKLAELSALEEFETGSVALRRREVELTAELVARLELRLATARSAAALEQRGGRVEMLLANLEEQPGHEASIDALAAVLTERGRFADLAKTFEDQAGKLEAAGDGPAAAKLYARVAAVVEPHLNDTARAITALGKVVELDATNDALDALARLHTERNEPGKAAEWLERRLKSAGPKERVPVLLRLARARIQAEQREAAVHALKTAFDEAPRNAEVRKLLIGLHRQREDWRELAATLSTAAEHATDEAAVLTYAREAAEIYHRRLKLPELAVPALRKASGLAPDDRVLKTMLAEGLLSAGEPVEAEQILGEVIASFGRRGSQERAAAHLLLARVLRAQSRNAEATDQLDVAVKMDPGNVKVLHTLAQLARESGQLDRAERSYRSLLLTIRRLPPEARLEAPVGAGEALLELSQIATDRGQSDQAGELVESALEALAENDAEAPRLQVRLREQGADALLLRLLDARLGQVLRPHLKAELLAEKAGALTRLGRVDEALDARLGAVESAPASPVFQEAALEAAAEHGKIDQYVALLESQLDKARRDTDAHVRCELLLRLGEVHEKVREQLDRAADFYAKAEGTGVREVDVWRAQARLAGARGDEQEQVRLLSKLATLGEAATETRTDALYRIAEVQLASEDTVDAGVESLAKAFGEDSRTERAGIILRRACEQHPQNDKLLDLYEQVARRASDANLLMHYLERRAQHAAATPEQAREAVDRAVERGEAERAEALMLRAVEIGRGAAAGLASVDWALLGLSRRRKESGDIAGAVRWLEEASEVVDTKAVFALGREVAQLAAGESGDLTLAAKLYEKLWEKEPNAREAWQPLADIYLRLGLLEKLERVVTETLDGLQAPAERSELRVALANGLMAVPGREEEAVNVLRDVLAEDPKHEAAHAKLAEYWERTGNAAGLVELLRKQHAAALAETDVAAIKATALRLGQRLEALEPAEAAPVYRGALERVGEDVELLRALVSRLGPEDGPAERARLSERLLALDPGSDPGPRALELVALYESMGDGEAVRRALELGYRLAPDNETIRERLEQGFREQGDFQGLARMLLDTVERAQDPAIKAKVLREAAAVQRDRLGDVGRAIELLRKALDLSPTEHTVVVDLAATLEASGDPTGALETMSAALGATSDSAVRLTLLRTRAAMRAAAGDEAGAVADLEEAFVLEPEGVAPDLESALDARRRRAGESGDQETERAATLRCVDVMRSRANRDGALGMLSLWLERSPDDVESLRRLRELQTEAQQWELVIGVCERLVTLDQGEAQEDAAMALASAYEMLGKPADARATLELAREKQPASAKIRGALRRLYEMIGAHRELARLLIEEAETMEDPEQRIAYLRWAGQTLVMVGDVEGAVPALRRVLELVPGDVGASVSLVDSHIVAGQLDEADQLLEEAMNELKAKRNTRDLPVFLHRKAHVARARGDAEQQLAWLQKAHQADSKNGDIAADLADLAEALEQWETAGKALRAITLLEAPCRITQAQALIRQGRIFLRQGDKKRAMMFARRAKRDEADPELDAFTREIEES